MKCCQDSRDGRDDKWDSPERKHADTQHHRKTYLGWMMVESSYWKGMERINIFSLFCFVVDSVEGGGGFIMVLGVALCKVRDGSNVYHM